MRSFLPHWLPEGNCGNLLRTRAGPFTLVRCPAMLVRRALACVVLLSCELCRVHGGEVADGASSDARENDGPRRNDTTWTRAVIGGLVLVAAVLISIFGVLVMAAKEEDGRAMTKILLNEAARLQSSADRDESAGQDEASQGSQADPRPMPRAIA